MRLEQLEYIAAVTQHGSLRRASEQLHVSQPALSEAVTKLERELGVSLLDRHRSGARISREGRELLSLILEVLEAADRLRAAAGDRGVNPRVVRLGTVNTATATLLVPAVRRLQATQPETSVEVLTLQQSDIDQRLSEGTLDLGLVNALEGDDPPADLASTDLVAGRPVVVLPADHPLTAQRHVTVDELRDQPLIAMRVGYVMHRYVHRIFGTELPPVGQTTDGAEMGKALVAEGLGFTILPDYSVTDDPLERAGLITSRPIADDRTTVTLQLRRRRSLTVPRQVRDLYSALITAAEQYAASLAG